MSIFKDNGDKEKFLQSLGENIDKGSAFVYAWAIAYRSREELGLSAAEIARHTGVSTSGITRAIEKVVKE